jgi:signal transduction histidine kinase
MQVGKVRVSAVTILVAIVMLLVPALAWMQYQWLGQLSTAERERMQRTLRTAAAQFATEFDSEISRTLVGLQLDGQTVRDQNWTRYAQQYSRWATSANEPRLVRDVWVVDTMPGTPLPEFDSSRAVPVDRLRLRKWNVQSLSFEDAAWPEDLLKVRDSLAGRFIGLQVSGGNRRPQNAIEHREPPTVPLTAVDDNILISPVTLFEIPDRPGTPKISILGFTIVRLDPVVVRDTILSSLAARHFHGDDAEADYRIAVVERDNPTKVIWESEPGVSAMIAAAPDVSQPFMGPRPDQMFVFARNLRGDTTTQTAALTLPAPPPPPPPPPGSREPGTGNREALREGSTIVSVIEKDERRAGSGARGSGNQIITRFSGHQGRWTLMAKQRAGSLEDAVAAVRMRNLGISSGILMLLTLAVGLIVVSTRRAQNLARQQMEFVAAVSHELRTPVSVIGAAAGNLADGVVGDPQRVRKYGETIQGEARRLAETVERVLQLAGIAAGKAAAARTPVRPEDLIHESIAACRTEIENAGVNVEIAIAEQLPNVIGDVPALKSALQNLISNAVKYGGSARWIRISASMEPPRSGLAMTVDRGRTLSRGRQVYFAVEDRGLGIDAEDRKHIFEPFYRGRVAVSEQIQGSGLGLNLVMRIVAAHGGHVMVNSEPGKGSTFTLALPSASESESVPLAREATSPR